MLELKLGVCSIYFLWYTKPEYVYTKKYPTNISLQLHYRDRNMSTVENYPIYSFKNTFSVKIFLNLHHTYDTNKNIFCRF